MELKKINQIVDIFTDSTLGIFHALKDIVDGDDPSMEWLENDEYLDLMYYVSHSGEKYASPFYLQMLDHNKTITDIAHIILTKFYNKWARTYEALEKVYNPLNNYDMVEEETVASKITHETEYGKTDTEAVNSKISNTVSTDNKTFGFGSQNPAPTDKADSTSVTEASSDDNVKTVAQTGKDTVTTSGEADDNIRHLTRSGNIGVTTSQQMLQSELEIRKNIFIDSVMNDIDTIMCLKLY